VTPTTEGKRPKKKGYAQLVTNYGNINLELHCDIVSVPSSCAVLGVVSVCLLL
jgi:hypothetical protein